MMDLHDRLEQIAGPAERPTAAQIDADLARGRRALRRRRTAQTVAGSAIGAAALVTAFSLVTSGAGTGAHQAVADRPSAGATSGVALNLVAYKGAQPKGFTIDTVPDGWFVQTDNRYNLLIAPDRAKNPGPNVDPSKAPVYDPNSFVDKIGVYLQAHVAGDPSKGTPIKVGDRAGVLVKSDPGETPDGPLPTRADGDTGWQLSVKQPGGAYLVVQFWEGVGLTRDQMIELAAGVHAHKEAVQGVG